MVLGEVTWLLCLGLIPSVLQEPPRDQGQGNETSGEGWQLRLSRDLVITQMPEASITQGSLLPRRARLVFINSRLLPSHDGSLAYLLPPPPNR